MVYNTQNYWVFGFCPPPGILYRTMNKVRKPTNSDTAVPETYHVTEIVFKTELEGP
jgi:hypothetical protein